MYRIALRTASVLSFVHAVMHQVGMMQAPTEGAEIALVEAMRAYRVDVMGSLRSYLDFYSGMSTFMTIMLAGFGLVLWLLAGIAVDKRGAIRPLLPVIGATFLGFTVVSSLYFFAAPVVIEALIAALIFLAFFKSRIHQG